MSRRGSTLGTVTEEEVLLGTNAAASAAGAEHGCWAQVTAGPVAEALAASTGTGGSTAYKPTPGSSEACEAVGSRLCLGSRQDSAEMAHSTSSKQPPDTSPHSGGRDGTSTLRQAPPASTTEPAAAGQLPLQSPFDQQNKPSKLCAQPPQQQLVQVQPTGVHLSGDSSSCQHGVELAGPAQLLLRRSSSGSSGKVVGNGPSSRSSSELSQRDDSATQLIRAGLCRSDDHAD